MHGLRALAVRLALGPLGGWPGSGLGPEGGWVRKRGLHGCGQDWVWSTHHERRSFLKMACCPSWGAGRHASSDGNEGTQHNGPPSLCSMMPD